MYRDRGSERETKHFPENIHTAVAAADSCIAKNSLQSACCPRQNGGGKEDLPSIPAKLILWIIVETHALMGRQWATREPLRSLVSTKKNHRMGQE